jgi:hypothetical protein
MRTPHIDGRICAGFIEPPDPDRTLILLDNPNVSPLKRRRDE